MEATSAGVQKGLHNLSVDRYLFERYPNSQVRTGRVIFWTANKVPPYIYITDVKVPVKQVGLPRAPPNTPATKLKTPPPSKDQEKPVEERAAAATEEQDEPMLQSKEAPYTPTRQVQRNTADLAGTPSKRKDISPLATPPAKEPKHSSPLDAEAPLLTIDFLDEIDMPVPDNYAVLSIYEDVSEAEASVQNAEIPSPVSKQSKKTTTFPHYLSGKQDRFSLSVQSSGYDDDTIFHYEGSYRNETQNKLYTMMRWVQLVRFGDGLFLLVLFKSRISLYRKTHGL